MGMKTTLKKYICNLLLRNESLYRCFKHFDKKIERLEISSLYEYCVHNDSVVKVCNDKTYFNYKKAAVRRSDYERWKYKEILERQCSKQYISSIENAYVRGDTDGVICANKFLTDKILFDKEGFLEHLPPRCYAKENYCLIKSNFEDLKEFPKAISLVKMWSYNYFHFAFEGLTKLAEIDKISEYDNWPIIIDECVRKDPRNIQIINYINYKKREIIWIRPCECIKVKELIVPPCMAWAVWNIETSVKEGWGYMIDKEAGRFLRETILRQYSPNRKYNCVYVARGNNNRLLNESDIIEYFEMNGFEIFYPDRVNTFNEELDCFSTANCIVTCAGGASTNLVYCKPSVDIFCLLPFEFRCDGPNDVTSTVGITAHMVDGEVVDNGGLLMKSTFRIAIEKCEAIVDFCKVRTLL